MTIFGGLPRKQIQANPKNAAAVIRRATAWRLKGELKIAIKDYNEAVRLEPKDAIAWEGRAHFWIAKKDYDKAISDCEYPNSECSGCCLCAT
ncbi:MAG TPA: hypothetical protein VE988_27105 [Gemmataceae bacterium]|nr:hypothetical protein [Gemmataceae bacterium]